MDKIRDLREKFFLVDDEYLNGYAKLCGINATGVYLSLCRHANKHQQCFPSKKRIAEELAISERSVYTALRKLEKWNVIKVEGQGRTEGGTFKSTLYILLDKKVWKPKPDRRQLVPMANGTVGKIRQSPQANNDTHRRQLVPNKDIYIKGIYIKDTHTDSFARFWEAYPRKTGKKTAERVWMKLKPSEELTKKILESLEAHKKSPQWTKDGSQFVPHPTTFLNQERWNDEVLQEESVKHFVIPKPKL